MSLTSEAGSQNQLEAAQLRLVLDAVPQFIVYLDLEQRYRFVNRVYEEVYSRRSDELLGRTLREVAGEGVYGRARPYIERALSGERVDYFSHLQRPSGEVIWLKLTVVPDFSSDHQVRGVLISGQDISAERRMAEEKASLLLEVQRHEAELKAMLQSMVDGVVMYSSRGKGPYFNDSVSRILGIPNEQIAHLTNEERIAFFRVSHENGVPISIDDLPAIRALRGETLRSVIQRWHVDDRVIYLSTNASPVLAPDGTQFGAVITFSDVTQERNLAEALVEGERRFRMIADAMPQIVCTAGPKGNIDYYNGRWYLFTGFDRNLTAMSAWRTLLHPEDVDRCFETYDAAIRTGHSYEVECRFWDRSEKRYRWFLVRALPVREQNGEIRTWLGTCTDIDDQKRATQAAQNALQTRDEFMSMASHELKTPLTTLMLQAQLANREIKSGQDNPVETLKRIQPFTVYIVEQVQRLNRLVEDMLNVTRIVSGKLRIERAPMDLADVVQRMLSQLSPMLTEAGCDLAVDVAPRIPGEWDCFRIEQVVTNLITNATRYSPGTPVLVRAFIEGSVAVLIVKDSGPGIAPEDHERLFQRFEQTAGGGCP